MSFMDDLVLEPSYREPDVELRQADGVFVKVISFDISRPSVGDQHAHDYDHTSVVLGPFAVMIGDENGIPDEAPAVLIGGVGQPRSIVIHAHRMHRFVSLMPGGILLCIHRDHEEDQTEH